MKKEKIFNIVISIICLGMLLVPICVIDYSDVGAGYVFIISSFIVGCKYLQFFDWISLFVMLFALLTIALSITYIVKPKLSIKLSSSVSSLTYVILWSIVLFNSNLTMSNYHHGEYIALLILYIIILITIVVLTALQYVQYIPLRRPSKTARLEQRIAELEQQVDDLKKGE